MLCLALTQRRAGHTKQGCVIELEHVGAWEHVTSKAGGSSVRVFKFDRRPTLAGKVWVAVPVLKGLGLALAAGLGMLQVWTPARSLFLASCGWPAGWLAVGWLVRKVGCLSSWRALCLPACFSCSRSLAPSRWLPPSRPPSRPLSSLPRALQES